MNDCGWTDLLETLEYLETEGLIRSEWIEDENGNGEIRHYPGEEPWTPDIDFLQ